MPATLVQAMSPGGRARSVSQPMRDGSDPNLFRFNMAINDSYSSGSATGTLPRATFSRSMSANTHGGSFGRSTDSQLSPGTHTRGRARSGSLVTVTEVGGDEPHTINDRLGVGANFNAAWVNSPGAWVIHPVLIIGAKLLIDAIPGIRQELSWTIVNLGYMLLSFVMFHHVTGVPFETAVSTGGAYDDLTLWEQIDMGAQYTPAKKWLTGVPICLFLISTHYSRYNPAVFALNFLALVIVLIPKLPMLHRLRFSFLVPQSNITTPVPSRPVSPGSFTF